MHEVIGKWSHREYELRLAWMLEQNNRPSRTDFYLMQIAAEVRRVLHKQPNTVRAQDFELKFGKSKKKEITAENAKERARRSKAFFGSLIAQATKVERKD